VAVSRVAALGEAGGSPRRTLAAAVLHRPRLPKVFLTQQMPGFNSSYSVAGNIKQRGAEAGAGLESLCAQPAPDWLKKRKRSRPSGQPGAAPLAMPRRPVASRACARFMRDKGVALGQGATQG
jgi:hypothetical protein